MRGPARLVPLRVLPDTQDFMPTMYPPIQTDSAASGDGQSLQQTSSPAAPSRVEQANPTNNVR
eukprot:3174517-Prorocentrum_lima.AAC.1